METLNGAASKN